MDNKISVIIPVYNTEKYLERCLKSVLTNTYENLEILCINDGSVDNSILILEKLAETDDRIKVISKENGGVASARNLGIALATGELISFIDSDDVINSQYFKHLLEIMNQYQADIVSCGYKMFSEYKEVEEYEENTEFTEEVVLFDNNTALEIDNMNQTVWGKLFRKDVINNISFSTKVIPGEDTLFNHCLLSQDNYLKIARTDNPLYYYYINRSDSIMHNINNENYLRLSKEFLNLVISSSRKKNNLMRVFRYSFIFRYEESLIGKGKEARVKTKDILKRALKELFLIQDITLAKKVGLIICSLSPSLYRLKLIMSDKTYINHEKNIRNKSI